MNTPAENFILSIEQLKEKGKYDAALKKTLEWLNIHMNDYRFYEELADIYIFQENYEKAEEVIQYARALHPDSMTGLGLEWYIFIQKWDFQKALANFEEIDRLFPNAPDIIQNIGWCNVMLGNMQKWIAMLGRAASLDPEDNLITQRLAMAKILYEENTSF